MNKWFADTFLPSIFERCKDHGKEMWLSQKQTAICVDNMNLRQIRFDPDGYGVRCTHNNYFCEWNGRDVVLSYSKKNGCGLILFGCTEAERETARLEAEAERQRIETERIERVKRDPELLAKRLAKYTAKIQSLKDQWEAEKEDPDYDATDAEWYAEEIAKFEAKLSALTN